MSDNIDKQNNIEQDTKQDPSKELEKKLQKKKEYVEKYFSNEFDKELSILGNMLDFAIDKDKLKIILIDSQLTGDIEKDKKIIKNTLFPNEDFSFSNILSYLGNKIKKGVFGLMDYLYDITNNLYQKQKEIEKITGTTKQELDKLKDDIQNNSSNNNTNESEQNGGNINGTDNEDTNNGENDTHDIEEENQEEEDQEIDDNSTTYGVVKGVAIGTVSTSTAVAIDNMRFRNIEKTVGEPSKKIDNLISEFEKQLEREGFKNTDSRTKQLIQKNIENLRNGSNDISKLNNTDVLKDFDYLQKNGILKIEDFNKLKIDESLAKKIKNVANNPRQLSKLKIAIKNENKNLIKKILGMSEADSLSDDLFDLLGRCAKNADEFSSLMKQTSKVLKYSKLLKNSGKFFRRLPYMDLLFMGIDIWQFTGEKDEALKIAKWNKSRSELMKQRANTRLWIGLVGGGMEVFASILTASSLGGPAGMLVGLGVGASVQACQYAVDTMYYDVKNFYEQNHNDLLKQERTELKQAIISAGMSVNPDIKNAIHEKWFVDIEDEEKNKLIKRAWEAIIISEEGWTWNDKEAGLVDGDNQKSLETRMKYIKAVQKNPGIKEEIKNANVNIVGKVVSQAKFFEDMIKDEDYDGDKDPSFESISKYKDYLTSKLKTENPESFEYLMNLADDEFFRIYKLLNSFDLIEEYQQGTYKKNKKLILDTEKIRSFGMSKEEKPIINSSPNLNTRKKLINFLGQETLEHGLVGGETVYSKENLGRNFTSGNTDMFDNYDLEEVSDDPSVNLLYNLAKKLHGYDGSNNMEEIISFFSKYEKEDALGFYFGGSLVQEDEWRINYDGAVDTSFSIDDLLDKDQNIDEMIVGFTSRDYETTQIRKKYIKNNPEIFQDPEKTKNYYKNFKTEAGIDTDIETPDKSLNSWFWYTFRQTVIEQRKNLENKDNYKNQIIDYIKKHGSEGYITLPYHLQLNSKKSGLGNCKNCFFTYKDVETESGETKKQIVVCTNYNNKDVKIDFAQQKEYLQRPYDELDQDEKNERDEKIDKYTNFVDNSANRLIDILSLQESSGKDELDIPEEYEIIIANKIKKWNNFKESLKDYNQYQAYRMISKNYEQFYNRFENIYNLILESVGKNLIGNDIDSSSQLKYILGQAEINIINYNKDEEQFNVMGYEKNNENIDHNKKIFFELIEENYKIGENDKEINIKNLAKSGNSIKAIRYANLIWKSIVEVKSIKTPLTSTSGFNINSKLCPHLNGLRDNIKKKNPDLRTGLWTSKGSIGNNVLYGETELIKANIKYNFDNNNYVSFESGYNSDDTEKINMQNFDIIQMKKNDKKITEGGQTAQKNIEQNKKDKYIWQSERLNLKVDTNLKVVKSWGMETKFEMENEIIKIGGIEIDVSNGDFEQVAYIGNFINFCKKKFEGKGENNEPFHWHGKKLKFNPASKFRNFWTNGPMGIYDTVILDLDNNQEKYSNLVKNKENKNKFVKYLNDIDKRKYNN